jgi:hypothetical protein
MANGHIYMLYNRDVLSSTTRRERRSNNRKMVKLATNGDLFFFATVFDKCFFSFLFFFGVGVVVDSVYGRLGDDLFSFSFFDITDAFFFFSYLRYRPDERDRLERIKEKEEENDYQ